MDNRSQDQALPETGQSLSAQRIRNIAEKVEKFVAQQVQRLEQAVRDAHRAAVRDGVVQHQLGNPLPVPFGAAEQSRIGRRASEAITYLRVASGREIDS